MAAKITIPKNNVTPASLMRLLSLVMLISITTIVIFSGLGIYFLFNDYIVKRAEADAISMSQGFVALNRTLILTQSQHNVLRPSLDSTQFQKLDNTLREYLSPFHVIKIKLFTTKGLIAYSTDRKIIGQNSYGNQSLNNALSGYSSSKMQTKNLMTDLALESRFDVDVVETYVPIYNDKGRIVGSFEIYQDMTRFRDDVVQGIVLAIVVLLVILLCVAFIAFKMVQLPTKQLGIVQEKLQYFASMDSLTSVFNRHQIFKILQTEIARAHRLNCKLSLILIDLDKFKTINDQYGHPTGDEVLRQVAKKMLVEMRQYDTIGRYGGEEFLIVLPGTNRTAAVVIAERVRSAIQELTIVYHQQKISISISAGVATLSPADSSMDLLIKRADKALYEAKDKGRNQVIYDFYDSTLANPLPSLASHDLRE